MGQPPLWPNSAAPIAKESSEGFDDNWKPTPTSFNVGHLFEWASLFSRAVELGADPKLIPLGSRFIDLAIKVGYDQNDGGAWMNANLDGSIPRQYMIRVDRMRNHESHRAVCHSARPQRSLALLRSYAGFHKKNFMDPEYGGWFEGVILGWPREALGERASIKGAVDGPEPSAYHQTTFFTDLLHLTEPQGGK